VRFASVRLIVSFDARLKEQAFQLAIVPDQQVDKPLLRRLSAVLDISPTVTTDEVAQYALTPPR